MKVYIVNACIALTGIAIFEMGFYLATTEAVKLDSWAMFGIGLAFEVMGILFVVWALLQVIYYLIKGEMK